jgi:serine/threonine protein kinase/TolB-like protein
MPRCEIGRVIAAFVDVAFPTDGLQSASWAIMVPLCRGFSVYEGFENGVETAPYSKSDRWQRIEELFNRALDLEAAARSTFLDEVCAGDPALRDELESLLAHAEKELDALGRLVHQAATQILLESRLARGTSLGYYRLSHVLGAGGMGEVYLAEDTRLNRKVALKTLRPELTSNQLGLKRFEREARTVSALNHPNILTVYEFGYVDGIHFLAAEYVEGPTLRQKLENGRLGFETALDIAIQLCSALAAAHSSGVVHRDLKPENVIIRPDGVVKVVDFGIAKLSRSLTARQEGQPLLGPQTTYTQVGSVLGTAKYMSPEQARGSVIDARSDIFALGAVIYEMLAGRAPFEGETESDLIAEILKGDPPSLAELAHDVSAQLERIISKAMRKRSEDRYQTVNDLLADLQNSKGEIEFQAKLNRSVAAAGIPSKWLLPRMAPVGRRRVVVFAAVLLVAAFVLAYFSNYFGLRREETGALAARPRSLAVLPFRNVRRDPAADFLGFSLADAVITKLGYLGALTVRPSSAVEKYRNQIIDPRQIASQLKIDMLLTGSFIKDEDVLRITAQLIDVKTEGMLWQDTIDVNYDKLLTVQDRVAQLIIRGLELKLSPAEIKHLKPDRPIGNLAYEFYLRGVDLYAVGNFSGAVKVLEKSASIEPNYGPTWAHLGRAYTANATLQFGGREQYTKAEAAYERAIALDPSLIEPRIYMANLFTDTGRVEQAVPLMRAALQDSPNNAEAHWELGYAYRFGGMLKESIAESERARQLDPEVKINSSAMNSYFYTGDYDKFLRSLPSNDSAFITFYRGLGEYYKNGREQALNSFDRAFDLDPSLLPANVGKALSYAIRNDNATGLKLLHEVETKIRTRGVRDAESLYKVAQAYAVLDEKYSALRVLRQTIEGGFFCYSYMLSDPLMRSLHKEAEFQMLMNQARQRHEQFKTRFFTAHTAVRTPSHARAAGPIFHIFCVFSSMCFLALLSHFDNVPLRPHCKCPLT